MYFQLLPGKETEPRPVNLSVASSSAHDESYLPGLFRFCQYLPRFCGGFAVSNVAACWSDTVLWHLANIEVAQKYFSILGAWRMRILVNCGGTPTMMAMLVNSPTSTTVINLVLV